jgi:hypothetical protein
MSLKKVENHLGAIWMTAFVLLLCLCAMCGQGCEGGGGLILVEEYDAGIEDSGMHPDVDEEQTAQSCQVAANGESLCKDAGND